MGRTIEEIAGELGRGPQTALVANALRLLTDPDIVALKLGGSSNTAANFLRTYKGRLEHVPITGLRQQGLAEFVSALAALPPALQLYVSGFETVSHLALFWTDPSNQLVGTVLIERADDRASREWFHANLT